jgi:hypothetical protein
VSPYKTHVFNPLTGAMKCLKVQISLERLSTVIVTVSPFLMVFVSNIQNHTVRLTDENSEAWPSALGLSE